MLHGKKALAFIVIGALITLTLATLMPAEPAYASVSCGSTITTNTTLTSNLTCSTAYGIIIRASGITLNCAGHTITEIGLHAGTGDGVYIQDLTSVIVENCKVKDWGVGFFVFADSSTALTDNTATNNKVRGFELFQSSDDTIANNAATSNRGTGFGVFSSSSNTLYGNTASGNKGDGFEVDNLSSANIITNNAANSNHLYGYADSSSGSGTAGTANTYARNTCSHNTLGCSSPPGL